MMRCWLAMRTGQWLERLDDVHETEDMLMHMKRRPSLYRIQ